DRFFQCHAVGYVSIQRIVGAGLVGEDIGNDVAPDEFREHIRCVCHQTDGDRFTVSLGRIEDGEDLVEGPRNVITISAGKRRLTTRWITVNAEEACAVHGGGERLRAADATHSTRDNELTVK